MTDYGLNDPAVTDNTQILRNVAERILTLKLEVPCIFFLESSKPLAGIAGFLMNAMHPLLEVLFGVQKNKVLQDTLSNPEKIEELIRLLENGARRR